MASLDTMLRRSGGLAPGVPLLRQALALGVLVAGAIEVNARFGTLARGPLAILPMGASAMLLALTGFLLARSAGEGAREGGGMQAGATLLYRYARRLLPPLVISLLLTIVVLGAAFTTSSPRFYLQSGETWRYLGNTVGWASQTLPGVFEFNNASGTVNATLWIVPVVLFGCLFAALAALGSLWVRRGLFVVAFLAIVWVALASDQDWLDPYALPRGLRALLDTQTLAGAGALILGMAIHAWRRHVPIRPLFIVAAAGMIAGTIVYPRILDYGAIAQMLLAMPLAYLAVALVMMPLPAPWPFGHVNYSLGIILYAYPVEQAAIALRGADQSLPVTVLLALPVTLLLAAMSWHLVERPLLVRSRGAAIVAPAWAGERPRLRSLGWYGERARGAVPVLVMIVGFAALVLALMAVTMFALQRDQPGM